VPPYAAGDTSLFFETFNRNKQSLMLDIEDADGRAVFEDLVRVSQVVFSNLRGDVAEKIGITYEQLKDVNPAIVCCSLSGYGRTGPRSSDPGYDYMLQALCGWMSLTGEPDGPPQKSGLSLVDYSGGIAAALAMVSAVRHAERTGVGVDIDMSLYDTAIGLLNYIATWQLSAQYEPERTRHSAHPSLVPFQVFEASDGWLVVGCAKEKFWVRMASAMGRADLADDERFQGFQARQQNQAVLLPIIESQLRRESVEHWITLFREAGVPCGEVKDVASALADPHTIARELIVETDSPTLGRVTSIASPVRVGERRTDHRPAPAPGEHQAAILESILGYSADRIAAIEKSGAFGEGRPT
jgi:crotonobetainyl-CoA:carnitine CoA-transferase CaiB-like acyl-CoA transferase